MMAQDENETQGSVHGGRGHAGDAPEQTAPIWYGEHTQPLPRAAESADPAGPPPDPAPFGAAYGPGPLPQGPADGTPGGTGTGTATAAAPAGGGRSRRWTDLSVVALLAALLASGGTYAATQLGSPDTQASSTVSSSLGGSGSPPVVQADAQSPNWTATANVVSPSVVAITVRSGNSGAQGSGVIIDDQGHILTNNHVVADGSNITVTLHDGRTYAASVAGTDPSTDLAVLTVKQLPKDAKPIAFGDSTKLKVGDPVMAVGNPLGLAGTVTTGIVSALNRPVTTTNQPQSQNPFGQQQSTAQPVVTNAIQTSAAINPGNSGGALVNAGGQLVGINSAIASLGSASGSGQSGSIGIGFAIPVNEAKTIASQLIAHGSAQHALLGVRARDGVAQDGNARRAGALIAQVDPGTPAAQAGLKTGDVVIAVDGQPVDSSASLVGTVRERTVGDTVTLTVLRGGNRLQLHAKLTAQPANNT